MSRSWLATALVCALLGPATAFDARLLGTPLRRARASQVARSQVALAVAPTLSLQLAGDTVLKFALDESAAAELGSGLNALVVAFQVIKKAAASGDRQERQEALCFTHEADGMNVLIECNPNAFPDAFSANAYVKVADEHMQIASECKLTSLIDAVKTHKAQWMAAQSAN